MKMVCFENSFIICTLFNFIQKKNLEKETYKILKQTEK